MKNIKDMDYAELTGVEFQLDMLHDSLENIKKLIAINELEDLPSIYMVNHLTAYQDSIDTRRKEVQEQLWSNQEASDMAHDTLQDLDNSQK